MENFKSTCARFLLFTVAPFVGIITVVAYFLLMLGLTGYLVKFILERAF